MGTPAPTNIKDQNINTPAGVIPQSQSYSYHFSEQPAHEVAGGSVKIVDPLTFPAASNFSAAVVTVNPGGMREIHWHPTSDEWTFFIQGQGRATLFSAPSTATTFDYRAGDVGYFPKSNSHYIENTGTEDLILVEVLQAPQFTGMFLTTLYLYRSPRLIAVSRYVSWPVDCIYAETDCYGYLEPE
jgi:oxalate decarboxylase family bicupin protein